VRYSIQIQDQYRDQFQPLPADSDDKNIGDPPFRSSTHLPYKQGLRRQSPLVYLKHSATFVRIVSAASNSHPAVSLAEDGVSLAERGWQQRAISDAFRAPISSDSQP
jgi:hypothetical protein